MELLSSRPETSASHVSATEAMALPFQTLHSRKSLEDPSACLQTQQVKVVAEFCRLFKGNAEASKKREDHHLSGKTRYEGWPEDVPQAPQLQVAGGHLSPQSLSFWSPRYSTLPTFPIQQTNHRVAVLCLRGVQICRSFWILAGFSGQGSGST